MVTTSPSCFGLHLLNEVIFRSLIFLAFGPVFSASPAPISTQTPYWLHPDAIRSAPDYTLFLEHVVSLLIKNVSDPQNFVRTEHLFWKAWKQFETALRNHKEEIDAFYKSMTLLQVTKDDIDKVGFLVSPCIGIFNNPENR